MRQQAEPVSQVTVFWVSRRGGLGLGEKDRWLLDFPAGEVEGRQVPEPHALDRLAPLAPPEQAPDAPGRRGDEGQRQHREPRYGAGEVGEHRVELGVRAVLR